MLFRKLIMPVTQTKGKVRSKLDILSVFNMLSAYYALLFPK
jgi:hypothetical protein